VSSKFHQISIFTRQLYSHGPYDKSLAKISDFMEKEICLLDTCSPSPTLNLRVRKFSKAFGTNKQSIRLWYNGTRNTPTWKWRRETWILRTWSGLVLPFTDSCPYPYGWEWFRSCERTDTDILGTQRREMEMTLILRTIAVASTWITAIPITKLSPANRDP